MPDENQQFGTHTGTQPSRFAPLSCPRGRGQLCHASVCMSVCVHGPTASPDPPPASPRLAGSSGTITLRCKDLKVLQLEIPGMEECLNIASSIEVSGRRAWPEPCRGAKGWQEKAAACSVCSRSVINVGKHAAPGQPWHGVPAGLVVPAPACPALAGSWDMARSGEEERGLQGLGGHGGDVPSHLCAPHP